MRLPLKALALAGLGLLSAGFDWPGQLDHFAYELSHADAAGKIDLVRLIARDASPKATELLLRAMEAQEPEVRIAAAESLNSDQAQAALSVLQDLCTDPLPQVRAAAIAAVARSGQVARALPLLQRALSDVDAQVRAAAATGLHHLDAPGAIPALLELLGDPAPEVRIAAVNTLGALGDPSVAPSLVASLTDSDVRQRRAVAKALGALGNTGTAPALGRLLDRDGDEEVRVDAALGLGRLGGQVAQAQLLDALPQADGRVARAVLAGLGHFDGARPLEALLKHVTDPDLGASAVHALAVSARRQQLARTAPPPIVQPSEPEPAQALSPVLDAVVDAAQHLPALQDMEANDALGSAFAELGAISDITIAEPLILERFMARPTPSMAHALGFGRSADGLMALLDGLHQQDPALRQAILEALDRRLTRDPHSSAADPLLEALPAASAGEQPPLLRLLGITGAERAAAAIVPYLAAERSEVKLAALDALQRLQVTTSVPALVPLLGRDQPPTILMAAARALGRAVQAEQIPLLLDLIDSPDHEGAYAAVALETALAKGVADRLKGPQRADLRKQLETHAQGEDGAIAYAALGALSELHDPATLKLLGRILKQPSDARRTAANRALGHFDARHSRPLLRFMLRHATPPMMLTSLLSLAEVGDRRELSTVMRLSAREHYPIPAAVPYAIGRWLSRAAIPARMAERSLCELMKRDEALLRTNGAAALARAQAGPCGPGGESPAAVTDLSRTATERRAYAHWLMAAYKRHRLDRAEAAALRTQCATRDPDAEVRRICMDAAAPTATPSDALPMLLVNGNGEPLANRLVGIQLADGSVFLSVTSPQGTLRPPGHSAVLEVIDPGLLPIRIMAPAPSESDDQVASTP